MNTLPPLLALAAGHLLLAPTVSASTPELRERGREIALTVDRKDSGYGDYVVNGRMTLNRPDGRSTERSFQMSTLEGDTVGDKRLVVFSQPRDLAGFASLTFSNAQAADDQWIYLPAVKRVKRLAARDKTGSFGGSEFTYEDITTWQVENYDYEFVQDEPCGEPQATCHTIANLPKYAHSGYSRLVETIDPRIWQPVRIVYYDKVGQAAKRLDFHDYQQYGTYWRPGRIVMTNLQDNASSQIIWDDYRFNTGLRAADMTDSRLPSWSR
ncbi:outer membrane lipoprotein-sorting protein [Pseudomonas sp. Irchel 3E20]|uniref:outer membrane lipoprotein-sorting protein n=1 Tax=Pseudomonas sp. Irchel 3E20 TaxID=2008983 RepID=UPI000BA4B0FB|nr:outer membrane lipoprotein-sorting protein [Pseudomonas sp. Irchel 3E20]